MPRFSYTARATGGSDSSAGTLDAGSRREALRTLQARGLQVLSLGEEGGLAKRATPLETNAGTARLSARDRLPFWKRWPS